MYTTFVYSFSYGFKKIRKAMTSHFYESIKDALSMLNGLEKDLNIKHFTPNELKVFYTVIIRSASKKDGSNITEIVENSGMSRSTVYKTLKKLSDEGIINFAQSPDDGRESLVTLNSIN